MRRAMGLVAVAPVAAAIAIAATLPHPSPTDATAPQITRLFMPAIKVECRARADVSAEVRIGYTFTTDGALVTIDRSGEFTNLSVETLDALNACLAQYPIEPIESLPRDRYHRNLLYDYYADSLRPCLAARVGELPLLPSRADFVVRLYQWDPYRTVATGRELAELLDLAAECPALPSFLGPG